MPFKGACAAATAAIAGQLNSCNNIKEPNTQLWQQLVYLKGQIHNFISCNNCHNCHNCQSCKIRSTLQLRQLRQLLRQLQQLIYLRGPGSLSLAWGMARRSLADWLLSSPKKRSTNFEEKNLIKIVFR